jgi:hypothetical protein
MDLPPTFVQGLFQQKLLKKYMLPTKQNSDLRNYKSLFHINLFHSSDHNKGRRAPGPTKWLSTPPSSDPCQVTSIVC